MSSLAFSNAELLDEVSRIGEFISNQSAPDHKLLLGLSGGIDSDVTGRLCVRAVGPDRLKCFTVLQEDFDSRYVENARTLAEELGVQLVEIPFGPFPSELISIMARADPNAGFIADKDYLDVGRSKCALRTFIFSAYAERGHLVVGPSNRTEFELGYFLPFGDGLAHLTPIIHLYKVQVQQLARILGTRPEVIAQPPAAGFWIGDEDLNGLAYWLFNEGPIEIDLDLTEEEQEDIRSIYQKLSFKAIDQALVGFSEGRGLDDIATVSGLPLPIIERMQKLIAKADAYKKRKLGARLPAIY